MADWSAELLIPTSSGTELVFGKKFGSILVHRHARGRWRLIHIGTRLRFPFDWPNRKKAVAVAEKINAKFDLDAEVIAEAKSARHTKNWAALSFFIRRTDPISIRGLSVRSGDKKIIEPLAEQKMREFAQGNNGSRRAHQDQETARMTALRLRPAKYRNVPIKVDGVSFDSKREAAWYSHLKLMAKAGAISNLVCHPRYDLTAFGGKKVGQYEADFVFVEKGRRKIVDVKGFDTPLSKWKRKHAEAQYGVAVEIWR